MAKNWEYARMSREAAAAGGPEALLNAIKEAAYNRGISDTKSKLIVPLLLCGIVVGVIGTCGGQKLKKWISEKKEEKLLIEQGTIEAEKIVK